MVQVLKDELRERLLAAALEVFAARGYAGATMAAIAERAGVGTASTYRYFANKRELFDAALPAGLAAEFDALLDRRLRALARSALAERPRAGDDLGGELLRFWIEHRLAVVILLDRDAGTPYEGAGARFVARLVAATLASLGEARGAARREGTPARFVLERIFDNTRRMLAAILEAHEDEGAIREAVEAFWAYQIPGLRGLSGWLTGRAGR